MRKFSAVLEMPKTCQCCDAALPASDLGLTRGTYRIELEEGDVPTTMTIGNAVRVTLSRGALLVELRHSRQSKGTWALLPHYNSDAFGLVKQVSHDEVRPDGDWYWHTFSSRLPEFKTWYTPLQWWAELKFVEVDGLTMNAVHGKIPAHNAAKFSIRIETLE